AVQNVVRRLHGAYAIVVMCHNEPDRLIVARQGCPVVVGEGEGESFVASDVQALLPVTRAFRFLAEGGAAELGRDAITISDSTGSRAARALHESELSADDVELGQYAHYMQKEIYEQPRAVADTLVERFANGRALDAVLGPKAAELLPQIRAVHIVA